MLEFHVQKTCGQARLGELSLSSGKRIVETPAFMPVGTQASVKGITPEDLAASGTAMILCNTYHLMMRPGAKVIARLGGLHRFMNWEGGMITDSGGFQVYSLAKRRKVDQDGVTFQHHLDGTTVRLEPEIALNVQRELGSDIAMVLDECIELPASREQVALALDRTLAWARRSRHQVDDWEQEGAVHPSVFAVCQGGTELNLRRECAEALRDMNFPGYALGGFAVGEPSEVSYGIVEQIAPLFPGEKPRYLMGVGTPQDLVMYAGMGVDLFDCVLPTRNARNGQLFTSRGKLAIGHAVYTEDEKPLDPDCACPVCRHYSRAYLRHLYLAKEILSSVLNTLHNLHYYQNLMKRIRSAIREERYEAFKREFFELQKGGGSA